MQEIQEAMPTNSKTIHMNDNATCNAVAVLNVITLVNAISDAVYKLLAAHMHGVPTAQQ